MPKTANIKAAFPDGHLENTWRELLAPAGWEASEIERKYSIKTNDRKLRINIVRPQEIPKEVEKGKYNIGITGLDWVVEQKAKVLGLLNLEAGEVDMVLAAKVGSNVRSLDSLKKLEEVILHTEYPNTAAQYIEMRFGEKPNFSNIPVIGEVDNGSKYTVKFSYGKTEVNARDNNIIIDNTSTGKTLSQNNLKIIDKIYYTDPYSGEKIRSSAWIIADPKIFDSETRKSKILQIINGMKSVLEAKKFYVMKFNIKSNDGALQKKLSFLPTLESPTISGLFEEGWYAVETAVDATKYPPAILSEEVQKQGGMGIITYNLRTKYPEKPVQPVEFKGIYTN